ncbi:glycogen synthase GlgA [Uliginosibacterium sp. H3]|uniref:Glycogen synthase n=1 Tax=Uliginosibacterium silvisoli TaxID=3114758 RepID=A0ABU6K7L3_9RHOO|nr:glycogen synthase GlgA [Uliginosibacterium sp. H3]
MRPHILFVAAEAAPLAKTGGLGDVVGALADALNGDGIRTSILMPGYPSALAQLELLKPCGWITTLPGREAGLWRGLMPDSNVEVILLRDDDLFCRPGGPYLDIDGREYADNALRFAALGHAAAIIASGGTEIEVPQVVHAHDWHAGLVPLLMRHYGSKARSVFTIHNLAFQGNYPLELAEACGVPAHAREDGSVEYWGQLSFMKAALNYADRISTVSDTYAQEILTPEFGAGFDGMLRQRVRDLVAVPNGIDTECWNPAEDELIARNFSQDDLRGKHACKRELQKTFGLPFDPFAPLLAMGSRLTGQKMADVAIEAFPALLAAHPRLQIAVLGCGDREIEEGLRALALAYPARLAVHIGYDEAHAHCLHAGADMLLHGSRFEPFGLTPLYAMRYGTVPVASRLGGLADTILDAGDVSAPVAGATGFLFSGETAEDMISAVDRALAMFAQPQCWRALQRADMAIDAGWEKSSQRYIELYRTLIEEPAQALFQPVSRERHPRSPEQASMMRA